MTYSDLMLPTAPVVYLPLNDAVGAPSLADASGNGHAAALVGNGALGSLGLIPGETDTALTLSGTGVVSVPNLSLSPPFSLSCIVQPTGDGGVNTGYGTLFGYSSSRRLLWADPVNQSRLLAQMGAANLNSPAASVPAGHTAHVAYTNDGHTETVYVNGVAAGSQANAVATWNSAFFLGGYATPTGSYQLAGTIEKAAVHNVCLSAATIANLASEALNPTEARAVTAYTWNGSAYVPASAVRLFIGSSQPAAPAPNDVWIQTS